MPEPMEAVLSCGDVVTQWADRRPGDKVHWTKCPTCSGQWRVVTAIRAAAPAAVATRPAHTPTMAALVSADGSWRVEPIMLDQGNGPRLRYRITRWGVHVATVARVEDVGRHLDLADLSEEPARDVRQPPTT